MDQWVVFGFGEYLADIFDIIHCNGGKIRAVVGNITYTGVEEDNLKRRLSAQNYNIPILYLDYFHQKKDEKYCYGINGPRLKLVKSLKKSHDIKFSCLIHPTAYLGSNVSIGEGVCIGPHAVVGPNCKIGNFCLINRAATIGHDVELAEGSTIAPGVNIAGLVNVGCRTTIGIGATVIEKIHIGMDSIVGAGSVVLEDVPDEVVVVGTPARVLRKNVP
jgi:sugar O-acyltransferase (sialic acid O-acetyltransferase NeuD family)